MNRMSAGDWIALLIVILAGSLCVLGTPVSP
jgi:hypothetical protein